MRNFLIFIGFVFVGCSTTQKANENFYFKVFLEKSAVKTMRCQFEMPGEDASIKEYVLSRSTTGKYWYTVKTIKANKRPSVYDFTIPYSYGFFRIKINKTKGYVFSKNLYVNK